MARLQRIHARFAARAGSGHVPAGLRIGVLGGVLLYLLLGPHELQYEILAMVMAGLVIGTAVARRLTRAMGGPIGPGDVRGEGMRVRGQGPSRPLEPAVIPPEAPLEPAPAPVVQATEPVGGNVIAFSDPFLRHRARVRSLHVLVADDDAAHRMVLQRLLRKAGHRSTCVDGGEHVLDLPADARFDLVIADLRLSGVDMARRLRRIEAGGPARTPVVILPADATPAAVRACQEAGAWGVLARPVATARLLDLLGEVAEGRAGGRARHEPAAERIDASVFDPAVLDELASIGTGGSFERRFTAECLADAERGIGLLADCASRSDWAQVREHALAIKGVAGGVGLVRLAATAGEMTRMPDWQLAGEWRSRVSTLRERLAQGRELLATRHEPCRNYVRSD